MFIAPQVRLLRLLAPRSPGNGKPDSAASAALNSLGGAFWARIAGKTVIDFGCGEGDAAIELARRGAQRVIGIDIREEVLESARRKARACGVDPICSFAQSTPERADIILSLDAFEHFAEPAAVLRDMEALLKPAGEVVASFGPTWLHPRGGHLFSVFPWAHLIFSEEALIRWRSGFKADGATRFAEVAGGLNQITIRRFESVIRDSPFQFASLETVPIRKLRCFHNRLTREFTTAAVRCRLVKRAGSGTARAAMV